MLAHPWTYLYGANLGSSRAKGSELSVFLDEVFRLGRDQLREVDWRSIQQSLVLDGDHPGDSDHAGATNTRVKLHRARKKLARSSAGGKAKV